MKCDVCGFEMTDEENETSRTLTAVLMKFEGNFSHPITQRVKDVFGKTEFAICHVCWLKSLGVKPI